MLPTYTKVKATDSVENQIEQADQKSIFGLWIGPPHSFIERQKVGQQGLGKK